MRSGYTWASRTFLVRAVFSFLYFLKIKISKIYIRFEIFQKYLRSPPIGQQALSVIFFVQIRNEVPRKKRPCRPPNGRQGPVAPTSGDRWAQRAPRPTGAAGGPVAPPAGDRGACRPPLGRPGYPPIKALTLPFPPHLSPKIPPKIQKKREE